MATYSHINQPFSLPKDFDSTGTDIKKCLDPETGFLEPKDGVVYTFLIQEGMAYSIRRATAKEMESKLESNSTHAYTVVHFVSPAIDEPDHDIAQGKVSVYVEGMVEAWKKCRSVTTSPSKVRKPIYFDDIKAVPHPSDNKLYLFDDPRFRGVVITESGLILGYYNRGCKIPAKIFKDLYINYAFDIDFNLVESEPSSTSSILDHAPWKIKGCMSIITKGLMEGIVIEPGKDPKGRMINIIVGYGPNRNLIPRSLAAEIIVQHVVEGGFYMYSGVVEKPTRPLRYIPNEGTNQVIVIGGPLGGLILVSGKKFFYLSMSQNISDVQMSYIEKYHPNIIVPC